MTAIWPDGTAQALLDAAPEAVQKFMAFSLWYESLSMAEQEKLKENLQQHGWSDKVQSHVSDEVPAMRAVLLCYDREHDHKDDGRSRIKVH